MDVVLGDKKWNRKLKTLLPRETQCLIALALTSGDYQDSYSLKALMEATSMVRITIRLALAGLEEKGLISIEGQTYGCEATTTIRIDPRFVKFQ